MKFSINSNLLTNEQQTRKEKSRFVRQEEVIFQFKSVLRSMAEFKQPDRKVHIWEPANNVLVLKHMNWLSGSFSVPFSEIILKERDDVFPPLWCHQSDWV